MQKIFQKEEKEEELLQQEIELYGNFQSFIKTEQWKEIKLQIKNARPPNSNKDFCKIGYMRFKEMSKLILRYNTYYDE